MKQLLILIFCAAILQGCRTSVPSGSPSDQWTIYRGDQQLTGYSSSSVCDQPKLLWSFQTQDQIKSTPVISQGCVYIGSTDAHLYALALKTGQLVWSFTGDEAFEAPALALDTLIYVGSLNGTFYCLATKSGKELWRFPVNDRIMGSANWLLSPDGKEKWIVFGGYDNQLHCLNSLDGRPVWTIGTDNYINGAPATDGKRILFGGCDALLHVIDAATGQSLAEVDAGSYIPSSPAMRADLAFVGQYDGELL